MYEERKMSNNLKSKTLSGIIWSFAERIAAQFVSFVVSIILARLLLPEQYGIIAIVNIIIAICNVFITSGFSSSLIQKKDVDSADFSSVFYFGIIFSIVLYVGIYFSAPLLAAFYEYEELTSVIRVMALSLPIASIKSVEFAYVSVQMQFKKFFWSTLVGTLFSAVVGIFIPPLLVVHL